jgi:hypothetical protein
MKTLPPFNKTPNPLISGVGSLTLQFNCRNTMGFVLREISIARIGNEWVMIEGHVNTLYTVFVGSLHNGALRIQVNYCCT